MGLSPQIVPATPAQGTDTPSAQSSRSTGNALTSDFETFLRLLTAQLSNQDPLKPMESTEFVSQLASFSAVEQQTRTNTLLQEMIDDLSGQGTAGLADWIGRDVAVSGPVSFDGVTPLGLRLSPMALADSARIDIYDDFGTLVASQAVDPHAAGGQWSGILPTGSVAAAGTYRIDVAYFQNGTLIAQQAALSPGRVVELRLDQTAGPTLRLDDGRDVDPGSVITIFDAQSDA